MHSSGGPLLEQALRPTYEHSPMVRHGTSATEIGQDGDPEEAPAEPGQPRLNKGTGVHRQDEA